MTEAVPHRSPLSDDAIDARETGGAETTARPDATKPGAALARNALHLVAGQVAMTVLSIVMSAVLGRTLGAADFGLYYFAMASTLFAYTIVEWGQPQLMVKEVAQHPMKAGSLLGTALAARAAGAVAAAALAALAGWILGYDARTRLVVALLILAWLPTSLAMAFGLAFRAHERMDSDALTNVANKVLAFAVTLPALVLGARLVAVICALGAAGAGALGFAVRLKRRLRLPRLQISAAAARQLVADGFPLMVMNLVFIAQTYIETILLTKLTPASVVGWYGAAKNIMGTLVMPASILVTASFPRLSRTAGTPAEFKREVATALRPVLALAVLATVGTYLFADVAIGVVFGHQKFGPAVGILEALAPTLLLIFVDMVFGIVALAAGKAKQITSFKLVALALSTALAYPLIQLAQARLGNGAFGAILAFAVSETFMLGAFVALVPRGVLDRRMLPDLARAVLSGAASVVIVRVLPFSTPFLTVPACILSYAAVGAASGLFGRADLTMLLDVIRKRGNPGGAPARGTRDVR